MMRQNKNRTVASKALITGQKLDATTKAKKFNEHKKKFRVVYDAS